MKTLILTLLAMAVNPVTSVYDFKMNPKLAQASACAGDKKTIVWSWNQEIMIKMCRLLGLCLLREGTSGCLRQGHHKKQCPILYFYNHNKEQE
ncbi:MAG: hypothetical protein KF845_09220 [Cyclobacteriaceae bacterium]|nr:hypothetical protein [Cyclobacteriaceae bacterium]